MKYRNVSWVRLSYSPRDPNMNRYADRLDDWLNPLFSPTPRTSRSSSGNTSTSDFRFTYLGPANTYTPLHRDVYSSYSWSCNILGRKVWWLFPPDRVQRVLERGEPIFDVREIEDEGGGIKVVQEVCPLSLSLLQHSLCFLLSAPLSLAESTDD